MRFALAFLALVAAAPVFAAPKAKAKPPAAPAEPAPAAPSGPTRVKVLVLDVKSKDLSASEIETLTSLITAHLSRYQQLDVMSSVDIKRLVDLEAQKQSAGCDADSCLSEIAGAMGAELVFFGQAGKLGSTIILTLNVYDAKKGEAVGRQPIEARDLGQLPDLVGPAIDRMVQPLFQTLRAGTTVAPVGNEPVKPASQFSRDAGAMSQRAKEVFEQQEMNVCVDEGDRLKWWFCDKRERFTENAFVRRYREATGQHDLDDAEKNRNPSSWIWPGTLLGTGGVLLAASLPLGYYTYVDKTTVPALAGTDSGSSSGSTVGGELTIGAAVIGISALVYGGVMAMSAMEFTDGELTDHSLKEPEARDAAARYNDALAAKIGREYGASP